MEALQAAPQRPTPASRARPSLSPAHAMSDARALRQASSPLRGATAPSRPGPARLSSSPQGAAYPASPGVPWGGGLAAVVCRPAQQPAPLAAPAVAHLAPNAAASPARAHSPVRLAAVRASQPPTRQVSHGRSPVRQVARVASQAHVDNSRPPAQPAGGDPQPAPTAGAERFVWPERPTVPASWCSAAGLTPLQACRVRRAAPSQQLAAAPLRGGVAGLPDARASTAGALEKPGQPSGCAAAGCGGSCASTCAGGSSAETAAVAPAAAPEVRVAGPAAGRVPPWAPDCSDGELFEEARRVLRGLVAPELLDRLTRRDIVALLAASASEPAAQCEAGAEPEPAPGPDADSFAPPDGAPGDDPASQDARQPIESDGGACGRHWESSAAAGDGIKACVRVRPMTAEERSTGWLETASCRAQCAEALQLANELGRTRAEELALAARADADGLRALAALGATEAGAADGQPPPPPLDCERARRLARNEERG
ncbi:unnamed protein product [Prorocentrum cordatum]|uniref:Inositol-pentakisphosphate 2-kinase n=1 Tax=Prorocentrum cordatum TaxID=2364126 RepID=A0ABN9TFZ9_9DINO|nr:unnamed protein product [Polarella glacialis]